MKIEVITDDNRTHYMEIAPVNPVISDLLRNYIRKIREFLDEIEKHLQPEAHGDHLNEND